MKSLSIKLNKTKTLWKRSGFWGGLKIIFARIFVFAKSLFVSGGDVLFITGGVGDSAFYRTHNVAEELQEHGFKASVTISDNPFLANLSNKFKIFIFHRTIVDERVQKFIQEIKKQKREIIFDTDDLVYDPEFLPYMDYFQKMSPAEQEPYKKGIGAEIIADPYVKTCTTTTSFLAKLLRQKEKIVFIVPNKFSNAELKLTKKLSQKRKGDGDLVKIVYASGTLSHNKDFATIKDALLLIAKKYKNVRLVFMGPLDIPDEFSSLKNQVQLIPFSPRKEFFTKLSQMDINLAPLEQDNPFCQSKSAIKFTEAGALAIPTVAVKNQTFSEAINDGVDGFLATNTEEWVEKIGNLVEDEKLRQQMGGSAQKKILAKYSNKNSDNQEYYEYLRSKL